MGIKLSVGKVAEVVPIYLKMMATIAARLLTDSLRSMPPTISAAACKTPVTRGVGIDMTQHDQDAAAAVPAQDLRMLCR